MELADRRQSPAGGASPTVYRLLGAASCFLRGVAISCAVLFAAGIIGCRTPPVAGGGPEGRASGRPNRSAATFQRTDLLPSPVRNAAEERPHDESPGPHSALPHSEPRRAARIDDAAPLSASSTDGSPPGVARVWEAPPRGWRDMIRDDVRAFPRLVFDDARAAATSRNALLLGGALAGAIVIHQDLDGEVREATARQPQRWGEGSEAIGHFGEAPYQIAALAGLYLYSLGTADDELRGLNESLWSAFALTGLSTLAIKGIANTDRPSDDFNDGRFGFPSYHAASSFAIAAVLEEHYGPRAGLPAYAFAGLIGWSRIDERDHDLSDVVFGAVLGYVIGKSVAGHHLRDDGRVRILPYTHPTEEGAGLALDWAF